MGNNPMLARMEAKYRQHYAEQFLLKMGMVEQMVADGFTIAAHDVLGMGPGRAEEFGKQGTQNVNMIAKMVVDDCADDPDFIYTREKTDQRLRAIVGQKLFAPYEERYGGKKPAVLPFYADAIKRLTLENAKLKEEIKALKRGEK